MADTEIKTTALSVQLLVSKLLPLVDQFQGLQKAQDVSQVAQLPD